MWDFLHQYAENVLKVSARFAQAWHSLLKFFLKKRKKNSILCDCSCLDEKRNRSKHWRHVHTKENLCNNRCHLMQRCLCQNSVKRLIPICDNNDLCFVLNRFINKIHKFELVVSVLVKLLYIKISYCTTCVLYRA